MKIGVPKEIHSGEKRVALTPPLVKQLQQMGYDVAIEAGAGLDSNFTDQAYVDAGVEVIDGAEALWSASDIVLKVRPPEQNEALGKHEADLLNEGAILTSFIWPAQNPELMERLTARKANVLAMDSVPRISRSQRCDALSSMANIAGYRAVVEASNHFGRFLNGQITAAGKVQPAKVLIIGAGVAGLAAIGCAGRMGAIVRAFDTRPVVKEQVESMDAEFLTVEIEEDGSGGGGYAKEMSKEFIDAEMALFREQAREVDIIITTALIPGKPAPKLILEDMVEMMAEGSVIVDLAAEQGGNCELTVPGEVVVRHGVSIIGFTDLPSRLPTQSSQLYATNVRNVLSELTPEKDGKPDFNMEDTIIRGTTVIHEGEVIWPPPPPELSVAPPPKAAPEPVPEPEPMSAGKRAAITFGSMGVAMLLLLMLGSVAPAAFMSHLIVFVLSCFVGWQVVWAVTPALHTPLMSVTNAISGIIIIGALLQAGSSSSVVGFLAFVAILIASINIAGGFYVTQRMLKMFVRED
ncbi:Re/Si-specific NAD(P)(+) transhydrogenase subunit alpha [Motiliproteus coralliicola]|uniref:NAD(P) transhydrogenase subunit alpha n=1 Tax=Motiliproteus coralliicola TaxID=2283196 RepID=A0A369WUR3_9GAMM|nr:Re/Si-specific NAD(P)(+) transhydrogenase subunit alpha [Motiliproteus coralliicola]RDE24863.1 Re/Si-specific NAD(P)(+) transhydrogenase subunit alpha [Motiliproteus coralliicola]